MKKITAFTHLSKMKALGKLIFCLFQLLFCNSLSLLTIIIQLSSLQLFPVMGNFL